MQASPDSGIRSPGPPADTGQMRLRRLRLRNFSLLTKFGVLSALTIVGVGLVLGRGLETLIRDRTLSNAREEAVLVSRVGIQAHLSPAELRMGLQPASMMMLNDAVRAKDVIGRQLSSFTIWNRDLRIVYSSNHDAMGHSAMLSDTPLDVPTRQALSGALSGRTQTAVVSRRTPGAAATRLLEVYVPVRFGNDRLAAGVLRISLPYAPIAAAIAHDTRWLYALLATCMVLLYGVLFRIVSGASKALRRQSEANAHQALHDALTELPNRTLFRDRVGQAMVAARRDGSELAVMLIDLDRFKEINDTLGHHNGDLFLQQVGPRLRGALREVDSIARLGGDEFGILLPGVANDESASLIAGKIRRALEQPFQLGELTLSIEASIGIALYPAHAADVDTLIQRADVAMYHAKEAHGGWEVYAEERDQYTPKRLAMLGELRHAIDAGQLVLHYQPEADLQTGSVNAVEALVRWNHPRHGLLYPDEFIPLAEHTGLIGPLTVYVLDAALRQCRQWKDAGLDLTVSVNLSARNLLDVELPEVIDHLLAELNLEPGSLRLELTENSIMADPKRAAEILERLREIGVGLAIDDFGAGYSSLAYLKRLPVDELKIDKSFVMNMSTDENDAVIVRSTVDLGRNLSLRVVAEGVETEEVWHALAGLGCHLAQGYFLTKPIPAEALTAWFRDAETAAAPAGGATRKKVAIPNKLLIPRALPSPAS